MKKICVYTCITGDYDKIKELTFKEKNIDYYLFTNNSNLKSTTWNIINIKDDKLDNIRLARKIKVLGHELLKQYDITIWLDGASYIRKSVIEFIEKYCDLKKYSLIGFKHNERDCIYDEALECIKVKKDKETIIKKQIDNYKEQNYPSHNGLIESTILIRNFNDPKLSKTMKDWFTEITKYSYRDQLSFNYVAWKNNLNYQLLDLNVFDNDYFGWEKHNPNITKKLDNYYVYFGKNEEFSYGSLLEQNYIKNTDNNYTIKFKYLKDCDELKIEFANFSGIIFDNLEIKESTITSQNLVNYNQYFEYKIFDEGIPTIFLYGSFKENQTVTINIEMILPSEKFYLQLLKRFNTALINYMNQNSSTTNHSKIISHLKSIIRKENN